MKIFKNAWFIRFARKEKILDAALLDAVECAERGQVDADLGGGVIKQRIPRLGGGKSKGYRSIVLYRNGEKAFFVYGFSKNVLANIREDEEEQFKQMAKYVLALPDAQLQQLIVNGQFQEVARNV